jgi:hypothetical protein
MTIMGTDNWMTMLGNVAPCGMHHMVSKRQSVPKNSGNNNLRVTLNHGRMLPRHGVPSTYFWESSLKQGHHVVRGRGIREKGFENVPNKVGVVS